MKRTHNCGELRKENENEKVVLSGWVHSRRDHGGVIFIDLRDREGLTQIVFDPKFSKESHKKADELRREDVVTIKGKVKPRKDDLINPKIKTGKIEVFASKVKILNKSKTPPIKIEDRSKAREELRLKYRYLDLRRPTMQKRIKLRHNVVSAAREYFNKNGFLEIQTPLLVRSTPEGARDYVVPSRVNPGKFYALPQSPQLYKQILMISGLDKYYQIAPCLRDEDLRADRQPEHTQFDFEMSFVDSNDIREFTEGLYKHIFKQVLDIDLPDFPIITHNKAMKKYGTDKPDIRFDLFLHDVTDIVVKSDFNVFKDVKESGGIIKCINPKGDFSRKQIDSYIEFTKDLGAKGMAWMKVTENGLESNIAKYFPKKVQNELIEKTDAKPGSILMFIADKKEKCNDILSRLRLKLGKDLELIDEDKFKFCWVTDFPLFSWDPEEERWAPEHHMFTMPKKEYIKNFDKNPKEALADSWDLVLNGIELGSGSIRVNKPKLQERLMNFIGITKEEAEKKFGFLLEAYKYGGPPHGGMGLGVDRTVALMSGTNDIREVIAFPKNKSAQCPMDGSPSEISKKQLEELHIKLDILDVGKKEVFKKIENALMKEKLKFEVMEHDPVYTSKEAAKTRGTDLKQGVKALICKTDDHYVQICVPGDKKIDLEKSSKKLEKQLKLADKEKVKEITDCPVGAVPPFGNLFGLDVYIDKEVLENEWVVFNAGLHTKSIKMKSKDLVKLTGAKTGKFSK